MKPLPYGLANACENAHGPVCKCRCGGALHGIARGHVTELPENDPHFVHPENAQVQGELGLEAGSFATGDPTTRS